jgi:RNA recognition motif-containing protein
LILASFDSPAQPPLSDPAPIHCSATSRKKVKMKNIFVGNLSFNASEGAVRAMFEEFGTVGRVSIATDRDTGEQRGFGFVEMDVDAEGQRAIEVLSGRELNGRALTVNEARPKADRGSGGGGFGGQRRNNRY